jgi:pyridoxamine 5'-phosphate oxidase
MNSSKPHLPNLDDGVLGADPIVQFNEWYRQAVQHHVAMPDAMALATATRDGRPSVRMVLLKQADSGGFVFYSNYSSRKGKELSENPHAAMTFYWAELDRSVRIEGSVRRLPEAESDRYFASRPRESMISSLTSAQSSVVGSRAELDRTYEKLARDYEGKVIPRPASWGGYRLLPDRIEFWQQRFARLNDRILFTLGSDRSWSACRLAP